MTRPESLLSLHARIWHLALFNSKRSFPSWRLNKSDGDSELSDSDRRLAVKMMIHLTFLSNVNRNFYFKVSPSPVKTSARFSCARRFHFIDDTPSQADKNNAVMMWSQDKLWLQRGHKTPWRRLYLRRYDGSTQRACIWIASAPRIILMILHFRSCECRMPTFWHQPISDSDSVSYRSSAARRMSRKNESSPSNARKKSVENYGWTPF